MPLQSVSITIDDPALIDAWVEAANRNGATPEALILEHVRWQGTTYGNLFKIGQIISAAFIRRFTAAEYVAILAAAEQSADINDLVEEFISNPMINLNDPRLLGGLQTMAAAGLIAADRIPTLLAYVRPEPLPQRARNPDGTYKADDPATPGVNEAWELG